VLHWRTVPARSHGFARPRPSKSEMIIEDEEDAQKCFMGTGSDPG
jgi:hypothetical protein